MLTQKDFFFCYDRTLMLYLKSRGFYFITCCRHEISNNKFWLFHKTKELENALSDKNKQNKKG